jgi:uncharacterized protein (TIGR03435 family)
VKAIAVPRVFLILLAVVVPVILSSQTEFDVASIKENTAPGDGGSLRLMPGGGIQARHFPPRNLITLAYQLQPYQLIGAPDWARATFYDIDAKAADKATRDQTFVMLQGLLVDRFKLAFHRQTRQVDGYTLVRLHPDALGPGLRPSEFDCEKQMQTVPKCRTGGITTTTFKITGAHVWSLVQLVLGHANGPVTDETGLTGTYDMELKWSNDVAPADDATSIFTALQEQLGLKLERHRVNADVFVVDRFEKPTAD